jgi:formylglycine-generating enzyme required for sulfatase activity/class 3 adenylate cyclase
LQADEINQLLKARSEIDEELRRHKTRVTVLFTDVVGSTGYFDRHGDTAGLLLLHRHDHLVTIAVEQFQGTVIKTIGDSVMAEFPEPLLAVLAAIEIQRRLLEYNENSAKDEKLNVRAGINTGVGFRRGKDLLGDAVNVAARLTKHSGPSQILVSRSVWEETLDSDISYRRIPATNLEGKAEAEEIYEVVWIDAAVYERLRYRTSEICSPTQLDRIVETTPAEGLALTASHPATLLAGRYEILSRIGMGGMGVVFKAHDRETGEIVALKALKPEIADQAHLIEGFRNELRLARRITHKNVCRIYDFTRTDDIAFISMEFVEGESLRQVLNRFGALGFRKGLKIADQMCDGLAEAHAQGIVHCDLKPENFMIDEFGNVKLMDFGLAQLLREGSASGVGTPSYMAPEQTRGGLSDQRADIYALGLVLFEVFTGVAAFSEESALPGPLDIEHMLPEHVRAAILRCLQEEPAGRFQSVEELRSALVKDTSARFKLSRGARKRLLAVAGLAVLVAAFVAAAVSFNRSTEAEVELAAFRVAQSADTEAAWRQFLERYRDGQLVPAAEDRLLQARAHTLAPPVSVSAPERKQASRPTALKSKVDKKVERKSPGKLADFINTAVVPAGVFMMGNDSGKRDEKPSHHVSISGFQMSQTKITNRQYREFLEDTGHERPKDPSFEKTYLMDYSGLPVVNVSYQDAMDFCRWLSRKFDVAARLPTEAEWEYAALGGKTKVDPKDVTRYKASSGDPGIRSFGRAGLLPNGYGLYSMSGNVWEWVSDFYSKDYYQISPIKNPAGPASGTKRVIRGGSWADEEIQAWSFRRASRDPNDRSDQIGFRIVIESRPGQTARK